MKAIALTYNYDLQGLSNIGRFWAKDVYVGKDFIFDYSAASYATFVDKNPHLNLYLHTDDVEKMKTKMSIYNIDQDRIFYVDYTPNLEKYNGNLRYSFDVLNDFIHFARSKEEFTVKIDNDLVFINRIPDIENTHKDVLVWKYERPVLEGDPRMGEKKVSLTAVGPINYPIYNLGLFGLPPSYPEKELMEIYEKMMAVDIMDVSDLKVKTWHCTEQTANNWIFFKHNYNVIETYQIVKHHYDNKKQCIEDAKYLLK